MNWQLFGEVVVTLFVIMDPPGTVPVFLALTGNRRPAERTRAAWQAVTVAGGVITIFALFGRTLLDYMHISLPALQGAGGLLLLLVALELLTGKADQPDTATAGNVAMVPLGTPLLAGPGAIVATMVFVQDSDGGWDFLALGLGIAVVLLAIWASMRFSVLLLRVLKESGILLVTRIAGLLLSAIAVQLVADSVRAFVDGAG
ncbi:MarC family protein [Jiangella sp. DSM 45060]|uniref:MarC family protein n=1 Tax=Jiangella sp. DSM 45060 TaxID=1798224 RepID=UPI00087ACF58|nr:MarC family protein [Jiangella sp. DSM 45060]SDT53337.1 multiple antibiotic resistance protein [Jiangella sp. DSM 45060]